MNPLRHKVKPSEPFLFSCQVTEQYSEAKKCQNRRFGVQHTLILKNNICFTSTVKLSKRHK